ncbi:MAG: hypothetical protein H6Q90_1325 [Deltaproteobacteria bacterium]|nr:hypothetical protein [Deltaproteobacteria bacterium]
MAIAALVLGIVGLLFSFIPCLGMYAIPLTLLAVVLGALGMKKPQGKGMAIAGLVCGIVGTAIAGWWLYAYLTLRSQADEALTKFGNDIKEEQQKQERRNKPTTPDESAPTAPAEAEPTPAPTTR